MSNLETEPLQGLTDRTKEVSRSITYQNCSCLTFVFSDFSVIRMY
ncbi:unnamed protein product [Haemonchus placei]|uniref:Uncharacterized protein n=1 Tax=Haemonchus placei TaxID=6290 RepID=A0A0N4XBT9_HAEPC|nr:unnamed protein product [Haemonchus placei]